MFGKQTVPIVIGVAVIGALIFAGTIIWGAIY